MMSEMTEIKKSDCNILYLAQHKTMHQVRLFAIRIDPWVKDATEFGVVDCFPTVPFEIPDGHLSLLKKVDLLA